MRRAIRSFVSVLVTAALFIGALSTGAQAADLGDLVRQFEVRSGDYYSDQIFSSNHYAYTASELKMLATVIYLEARGEPYGCMLAVGNVVMNRVLSPGYPGDTIAAVVKRPNQFSYNAAVKPSARCMQAARDVLEREVWVVPQNTYFFRASSSRSDWGKRDFSARLGRTAFYRYTYDGRYNGSRIPVKVYARVTRWPQYGCKPGSRVRKVQKMLASLGYDVKADGYYGMDTKKAVQAFQKTHGLMRDGIAGPVTLRALIRAYGVDRFYKL